MRPPEPAPATLAELAPGVAATIDGVKPPPDAPHWAQHLADIGFVPGERVSVRARGWPGGDPLAVRVGNSTFALRRAEAACVLLTSDPLS